MWKVHFCVVFSVIWCVAALFSFPVAKLPKIHLKMEKKRWFLCSCFFSSCIYSYNSSKYGQFYGTNKLYTDRESRELGLKSMQQFTEMPIHAWEIKRSRLLLWIWNIFKDTIVTWLLFLFFPCPFCIITHPFSIFVYCSWWKRGLEANSKYSGIHWWN